MNWDNIKIALTNGEKITRPSWEAEHFWVLSEDGLERIVCHDGTHARVHLRQTEVFDWKIWKDVNQLDNINRAVTTYIMNNREIPNTIRLGKKLKDKFGKSLKLLGMDVLIDDTLDPESFHVYFGALEFDIFCDGIYETKEGRFIQVKEITYYNNFPSETTPKQIACIVVSEATVFAGDSRTTIMREVCTESQFREKVRSRVCWR